MYQIALKNLEFYGYHGLYQEESLIGNQFLVDIMVSIDQLDFVDGNLSSTVNYVTLFEIIKNEMNQPQKLLETVIQKIEKEVKKLSTSIKKIEIILTKIHVPIDGMIGQAQVSLSKEYGK